MRTAVLAILGVIVAGWLMVQGGAVGFQPAKRAGELKFGAIAPLTGPFASYGQAIRNGIELAREELDTQGIHAAVSYEDACKPAEALSAINKLTAEKIDALVGNFCLIAVPAIAPVIEKTHTLSFHSATASESALAAGRYFFSTNLRIRDEAKQLAELAANVHGAKTAAVLYISTDFGLDYDKFFRERFEQLGGKVVVSETSPIGSSDFRAELLKVKAANPDVVLAAHLGTMLGTLLKQAKEMGINQRLLGVYEAEEETVLQSAQGAAEGLQFFSPKIDSNLPAAAGFSARYLSRFGAFPNVLARNAYDGTIIAAQVVKKCGSDTECKRQAVATLGSFEGASGRFVLEASGAHRDFVLKEVRDGRFIEVRS